MTERKSKHVNFPFPFIYFIIFSSLLLSSFLSQEIPVVLEKRWSDLTHTMRKEEKTEKFILQDQQSCPLQKKTVSFRFFFQKKDNRLYRKKTLVFKGESKSVGWLTSGFVFKW